MADKFRTVNQSLGDAPKVGPFPADQIVPWTAITMTSYYLCKVIFGWSWVWTGAIAAWGVATWWVLTGDKTWQYLSKFVSVPSWTRGYGFYQQILDSGSADDASRSKKKQPEKKKTLRRRRR